jgi:hypothetical protein
MKKLHSAEEEIIVHASKGELWDALVNRFGDVNVFNPIIDGSKALDDRQGEEGCERYCDIDGKHYVKERLVNVKPENSFSIDIYEGGLPMIDKFGADVSLRTINENKTAMVMSFNYNTTVSVLAPLMKGMMRKMLAQFLIGFKYYMETGEPVNKVNIKGIKETFEANGDGFNFKNLKMVEELV